MVNIRTILFLSVLLPWHKVSAQFPSQNYVMSELQLDRVGSRRVSTTKVYDGLGRPVMEVTTGLGSSGRNVYTLQEYNSRGEVEKSWLPVAGSRQVQDISVSDIACLSFLTYSDSKAYTYSAYDALPANKYSSFNFIDGSNEQVEYEYNGVGALTKDLNRGMTVSYDNLNNPRLIDFKGGNSITYNYLSDGTLLSKHYGSQFGSGNKARSFAESKNVYTDSDMSDRTIADTLVHKSDFSGSDMMWDGPADVFVVGETEYSGNIIYSNGNIDKVLFPGGYCTFSKAKSDEPIFHYYTQDHLGNNRIVMNEDGTVEQITHYYPFGGTFNDAGLNAGLQHYKYNGKELDRIGGLNTYDYGARQYFSALPVWDRIDPKCEEDYGISPYAYCRNNPMKFIDKDGEKTILYATNLPGGPKFLDYATHTFIVVSNNNRIYYFAYGPQGQYTGTLKQVYYDQDKAIYKGFDTEHLKNRIVIDPPKGMTEDDFDKKVINVAKSFGNEDNFKYSIIPTKEDEGNCNTSSSTILYKSGISKAKLSDYRKKIKGIVTGFGNIKGWTEEEQKEAIENQKFKDEMYEKAMERNSHF